MPDVIEQLENWVKEHYNAPLGEVQMVTSLIFLTMDMNVA